jgi:hypothetical protein
MRLSNLPPGITESDLPGYDEHEEIDEIDYKCDQCGHSYTDHITRPIEHEGNVYDVIHCPPKVQ